MFSGRQPRQDLEAAVCLRRFHGILSLRELQDSVSVLVLFRQLFHVKFCTHCFSTWILHGHHIGESNTRMDRPV